MANPLGVEPVRFYNGGQLNGAALPIALADAGTRVLPKTSVPALGRIDASGYNTLSLFVTIADMVAGNTFKIVLTAVDPETDAAVGSNKGDATLISQTASASYATTLYLPSYYATLSGLVMPFFYLALTLSNTGGNAGTMHVTALKLWLSIA